MPRNPFPVRKTVYLSLTCLCFLLGLCRALLVLVQRDGAMPFLFCLHSLMMADAVTSLVSSGLTNATPSLLTS